MRLVAVLALLMGATGCAAFSDDNPGGRVTVAAAFYPLAFVPEQVGGTEVTITNLTQPGQEPHDLEISARQTAQLEEADAALYLKGLQSSVDDAVAQSDAAGIQVAIMVRGTPPWANGGQDGRWVPNDAHDFENFMFAMGKRYPGIRRWMIWGEPSRGENFQPMKPNDPTAPRAYAKLLDAAYSGLKQASRRNIVIGGMTFTAGDVVPRDWVKWMRLPNGKPPRLDWFGHNPFSRRVPKLADDPLIGGYVDFSSLDDFVRVLDRAYPQKLRLFLSEFTVPTGHKNWLFNFFEPEETAADWLRAALKISRSWNRIAVLGWYQLYDEPARPNGDETLYGLITQSGRRKPAFEVFRTG